MPGVLAVLTGADADADRLGRHPLGGAAAGAQRASTRASLPPMGSPEVAAPQPVIAREVVRYVGEIVAVVVARDAAWGSRRRRARRDRL